MRKIILVLVSLCCFSFAQSQEICDNGIDDDSDGLIDLNDPDCSCGSASVPSLIPNPSFDTMACCPSTYSQMNCAAGWVQASSATSDYMNTCGFVFGAATAGGLVPFPDGDGILGCIFTPGWQEYVGSCLNSPMVAGTPYTVQMNIASTPVDGQGNVCNNGVIDFGSIDIVLYGAPTCASLPFAGSGCPPAPWAVLGQFFYTPTPSWGVISITFTPTVNINAIIIGSPCTLPPSYSPPSGCYPYFYFDNILLNTSASFSTITQTGSICGNNFQLLSSTVPGATYQWYLNGVAIIGETNPLLDISANSYGTGNYSVVVTDGPNCSTASYNVPGAGLPTSAFDIVVSACQSITFADSSSASTGTITAWSWNFGDPPSGANNTSALQNPSHVFSSTGTYSVTLIVTSDNGCTDTVVIPVTVNPSPVVNAGADQTICSGDPTGVTLTATGSGTYIWNGGTLVNASGASQTVSPTSTTAYIVTVTDSLGCTQSDTVVVNVQSSIATASPDVTICIGESTVLNATGGITYSWSPATDLSNPAIANPIASPTITTTYTLTATNAIGCTDIDVVTVTVTPSPSAAFVFVPTVIFADSTYYFTDNSTGNVVTWTWNFGDGNTSTQQNPSHYYPAAGTYRVCLVTVNSIGCADSVCSDVIVLPRDLEAPNVFTPNGDATNDVLIFKNLEHYPNSMLQVYDRWGILVYENGNYLNDWNGKKNGTGADCVDGTYYYILSGPTLKKPLTGFVSLIRGK